MTNVISIDGVNLNIDDIYEAAVNKAQVKIDDNVLNDVRKSRDIVTTKIAEGKVIYGVNTGFGMLSDVAVSKDDLELLQLNLIRADMVGVGKAFSTEVVRAMMILRINSLVKGFSGIRQETLDLFVNMLNKGIHPVVPEKGSVGASGDLAPLAHLASVLIGEGKAEYKGEIYSGYDALKKANLNPIRLQAKEGLALINGTQAMTANAALVLKETFELGNAAELSACLTMEALNGIISAFDKDLLAVRPHSEIQQVGERIRNILSDSQLISNQGEIRMQDAYSIRCIPQVHGASWQTFNHVNNIVLTEMNSVTDNPIILKDGRVFSGGHFHGQPIALAMDHLKIAVAEWANISERRVERLVNPQLSNINPFLAKNAGLETGLMVAQYTAAALVSENKVLAHPSSVDSIPTSANQEDHVSMGTIGSRQVREMTKNSARVIAIEFICASQAIYLQQVEEKLSSKTKNQLEKIREVCPVLESDRDISSQIEELAVHILDGKFSIN